MLRSPSTAAWLLASSFLLHTACGDDSAPISITFPDTPGGGIDLGEVQVLSEGETLDLVITPSTPGQTVEATGLPANATYENNVFSFSPGFDQAGVYGVTFSTEIDGAIVVRTLGVRVQNVIHLTPPGRVLAPEGASTSLTFTSNDPAGTVVLYSSSLETTPIEGVDFNPTTGVVNFNPSFTYRRDFSESVAFQVTARGQEIDTGIERTSEIDVILDVGEQASLALEVQPIFDLSCATAGCHGSNSPAAGLNLAPGASHGAMVNVAPAGAQCGGGTATESLLVNPTVPADSLLFTKVALTASCGSNMPFQCEGAGCLSADEVQTISLWIEAGAANN